MLAFSSSLICVLISCKDSSRYIARTAYPKFREKLQVCKDLMYGFDYSKFTGGSPLEMAQAISGGVNFVLDAAVPDRTGKFFGEFLRLHHIGPFKYRDLLCHQLAENFHSDILFLQLCDAEDGETAAEKI